MDKSEEILVREYVKENVWRFDDRYDLAWERMGMYRCTLEQADESLFNEIGGAIYDWCTDNGKDPDDYDTEEMFG